MYSKYGIISLAENPLNILMWSHYSKNKGFLIIFKTDRLPVNLFGPFPINYSSKFEKLDLKKYNQYLRFLYETNVKSDIWELEDEWRYIVFNPLGKYHPLLLKDDSDSRKYKYERNAIAGIVLGPEFFNMKELSNNENSKEYNIFDITIENSIDNYLKKKELLDFIIDSNLLAYRVVLNEEKFALGIEPIKIIKINDEQYKLNYSGKVLIWEKDSRE